MRNQVLSYFYLRILLYTDFSASLPTACFGVSAKFAAASLLQVSRIFLAFRASVYCRCQNPSSFNWHQDPQYRSVLPFGLLHQSSQSNRNLTAAVSRRQPGHSFRYSRRGWQPFSAPSYTIYLSKQFSRSVSVFNRWIKYSISARVNRGKKGAHCLFTLAEEKLFKVIRRNKNSVDFFGGQ